MQSESYHRTNSVELPRPFKEGSILICMQWPTASAFSRRVSQLDLCFHRIILTIVNKLYKGKGRNRKTSFQVTGLF